jgi:hypothetical protein
LFWAISTLENGKKSFGREVKWGRISKDLEIALTEVAWNTHNDLHLPIINKSD